MTRVASALTHQRLPHPSVSERAHLYSAQLIGQDHHGSGEIGEMLNILIAFVTVSCIFHLTRISRCVCEGFYE